jgi:hypothetical protein
MSTPATALRTPTQHNVLIVTDEHRAEFESTLRHRIEERAYQLFELQGGLHGEERRHWTQAEAELLQNSSPVRETGSWSTANASLTDIDPQSVQVLVLQERAIVSFDKPAPHADGESQKTCPTYLLIRWPVRVDPATAAAYIKDSTLVVTAKHAATTGALTGNSSTTGTPSAAAHEIPAIEAQTNETVASETSTTSATVDPSSSSSLPDGVA